MIEGVKIIPLKVIADDRGKVMHMLRSDSPVFKKFGEIYFSTVKYGAIKAWKKHRQMILNLAVPQGSIKLVLYDDRSDSSTKGGLQEIEVGSENYNLIQVPPMVWNGFQGLSQGESLVANCATMPHDPVEVERLVQKSTIIPYHWITANS